MKPVLQESKIHHRLWILYTLIFIICTIGIGVALYLQYYQEQNIGIVFGITDSDSEEEDEYNDLKSEFSSLFTNQIEFLQEDTIDVEKIHDNYDIVVTAYSYEKNEENCVLDVSIPYININNETILKYNRETREQFKDRAEELSTQETTESIIYNVRYKSYIQDNILSLVIESELKEGNKSQKIIIKTYNYDLIEQREVTLEELLEKKEIKISDAEKKIKQEIQAVQQQNDVLSEQGYNVYQRDYNSDTYKVENTENYFLGKDGMIYLVYAYGNSDYTSDMDIVIFK
jgi:hypothetical protein